MGPIDTTLSRRIRRRHSFDTSAPRVVAAVLVAAMSVVAVGCSTTSGTGEAGQDRDGPAALDANFYPAAVSAVCTTTDERLAGLPSPGDGISEPDWATEVSMALEAEAVALGDVGTISDVRDDHRTFVTNTRDQAAQWTALSAAIAAADATGIDAARTAILELSRGRIELAAELGISGCRERTFG